MINSKRKKKITKVSREMDFKIYFFLLTKVIPMELSAKI